MGVERGGGREEGKGHLEKAGVVPGGEICYCEAGGFFDTMGALVYYGSGWTCKMERWGVGVTIFQSHQHQS